MKYRLYFAHSKPPENPTEADLRFAIPHEFPTESEALGKACDILRAGKYVAGIERPDGTRLIPQDIRDHCLPPSPLELSTRKLRNASNFAGPRGHHGAQTILAKLVPCPCCRQDLFNAVEVEGKYLVKDGAPHLDQDEAGSYMICTHCHKRIAFAAVLGSSEFRVSDHQNCA